MAVSREYGEVVQLLLRAGADRELVWNGETALDYANNAGLEEMATLLRA
jgi:ankyrin repeat protein